MKLSFYILTLLILWSANLSAQSKIYDKLFQDAVKAGNEKDIAYYLDKGADINCLDSEGRSALHASVRDNKMEIVNLLLNKGAKIDILDTGGRTPLMYAAYNGNLRLCYLLFEKGAKFQIKDKDENIALTYADNAGYIRVSNFLSNPKSYSESPTYYEYLTSSLQAIKDDNNLLAIQNTENALVAFNKEINFKLNASMRQAKASLVNSLANLYEKTKKYDMAEITYTQAIPLLLESYGPNSQDYVYALRDLSGIYFSLQKFEKAEETCLKIINIQKPLIGEDNEDFAWSLKNLADVEVELGKYADAEKTFNRVLEIRKKMGENNVDYATTLNDLGWVYFKMGNYPKAEVNYNTAIKIRRDLLGVNNGYYATSINNLAMLYEGNGNYSMAEPLYLEAIKIVKDVLGDHATLYAKFIGNLANLKQEQGSYEKALQLKMEVNTIFKNSIGTNNQLYATSLDELGDVYSEMNNYRNAEECYLDAMNIRKNLFGEKHPAYAFSLSELGKLYSSMGNYDNAKKFLIKTLIINKEAYGEISIPFGHSLYDLAILYVKMGDFSEAESLYLKSAEIYKLKLGDKHKEYASIINGIGAFYSEIGNLNKAEILFENSLKIKKEIFGENSIKLTPTLNNLAHLYHKKGDIDKAKQLYLEALKIDSTFWGITNYNCQNILNNLGTLFVDIEDYEQAEPLLVKSNEIVKNTLGETNPIYAASLSNLSEFYHAIGNYPKAEKYAIESLKIRKEVLGENTPEYGESIENTATLYYSMGNLKQAESFYLDAYKFYLNYINNNFKFLSESEREMNWEKFSFLFNSQYPSFSFYYSPQKPSISTFTYDNTLFTKGLLLNTSLQIQNIVLESGDSVLISTWNNLRNIKSQINVLESKPLAMQENLHIMKALADSLDKVLTQKSQLYKQNQADMQVKWTDVQKNLKPDEAAIEFISFDYYNKHYTDSTMYCALVLKKNSPYPEMIPLFEEKQLDSLFVKSSKDAKQLYTYRRVSDSIIDIAERKLNYGSKLYNLLWKPLEASLKNMKTVYYAPSGKLNQVAFAAIPVDTTFLLSDKYNLHQLTSTRQVIHNNEQDKQTAKIHKAALFGGIEYELDDKQLAQVQTTSTKSNRSAFVSDSTQRSNTFVYLKGTGEEVEGIAKEFNIKGLTEQLYTGADASEGAFKKLSGTNTDIIHVATHGFYMPVEDTKRKDFKFMGFDNDHRNVVVHNPLLRSGLAFAGANSAWRGDSIPNNWEDGILTSQEISQLNLTHTDLVVLSACETALGDIKGSEGVFGLQRAFKMAGVQTLIMSLWKVPDTQTSQLMQCFYKYWLGGMTKHDAFKKSQNEIRKANPNPYYWAAFVMVD